MLTATLGGIALFQAALAAGAPLGPLAWGGAHDGVLPTGLRLGSVVSAGIWGIAAAAVATSGPRAPRRGLLLAVAAGTAVGAVVNLASPSLPERLLWVPVTLAAAGVALRLRARRRPGSDPA